MKNREKFEIYYKRLVEFNKRVNLTAITDKNAVFIKHFEDSLRLADAIPDVDKREYKIIDIGTGAGFPGMPMAIEFPNLKITLADSLDKRLEFLRTLSEELELTNVEIIHGRAEDLGHDPNFREKYDIATCRAVSKLSTIVEYCTPLIHKEGLFIPLKSGDVISEIDDAKNAMSILSCRIKEILPYELSEGMGSRSLLIIEKTSTTEHKYPRKAGTPSKKPL